MRVGPVEVLVLGFPGGVVDDSVLTALHAAVDAGSIALLDVLFLTRARNGAIEVSEVGNGVPSTLTAMITDPRPMVLFSAEDIAFAVKSLEDGESALLAAVEHRWSRRLSAALSDCGGRTILHSLVPHDDVVEAFVADGAAAS